MDLRADGLSALLMLSSSLFQFEFVVNSLMLWVLTVPVGVTESSTLPRRDRCVRLETHPWSFGWDKTGCVTRLSTLIFYAEH